MSRRLDAHHGEAADARAHLDDALNLPADCADIDTDALTLATGAEVA